MRLFGAKSKSPQPQSESQWLVPWRDRDGRFSIDFPFRVTSTIDGACYGPAACRAGLLIGSVERRGVRSQALQILHAIPLEVDAEGQLGTAARERLTACRPTPGKGVMTVGLFVPEGAGEPEAVCALVASSKRLFPPSMVIAVVSGNGVAQLYEWKWGEDQLIPMSPKLRLQPSPPAEGASTPAAHRQGATAIVQTVTPAGAAAHLDEPEGLAAIPSAKRPQSRSTSAPAPPAASPGATGVTVRFDVPKWVGAGILVLGTCMLATGIWYVRKLDRSAQPPPQQNTGAEVASDRNRMALQVARRSGDLLITWDRNLQTNMGVRHGVLQITDGDEPNYLPLTVKDLTSAQVVYVPRSRHVTIQLTAFTDSTTLQETIRVIQANTPRVAETTRPAPIRPPQRAAPVSAPPDSQRLRTMPVESTPVATRANPPISTNPAETQTSEVVLPPPPVGKVEDQKPPGTIRLENTTAPPVAPAAAQAAQKPPEPSIDAPAVKPLQTPAPQPTVAESKAPPVVSDFKPPVAIRQVSPVLENNIKRMLLKDTAVSVKLRIGTNGNVLSAEAASGSGLTGFLGKVAEETARNWRFQPATAGGKPTPSDYSITFIFKR